MGISISIGISPRESLADWTRFTGELEQRGVDELWLIDSQLAMKDAYIGLALAAAQTESMRLGTGVSNLITRHPTVTANAIAAIAELSDGRALLGLGAGDSAVYGLGERPSKVAEVEEGLEFFGAVLDGREGTWQGRGYTLAQEVPRTPVYLAVSQPRMCRLAGRLADGVIVMGPAQPDLLATQLGWISEGIEEAGRSRSDVRVCFIATLSARDDREAALADVRSWASAQARLQAEREGAAAEPRAVPRRDREGQGGLRLRRAPLDPRPAPGDGQRRARAHARDLRHGRGVRGARAGAAGDRRRRPRLPAPRRRAARAPGRC